MAALESTSKWSSWLHHCFLPSSVPDSHCTRQSLTALVKNYLDAMIRPGNYYDVKF